MYRELRSIPIIVDVNSDQQNRGLQSTVVCDRETASRFGISPRLIDATLYDAFGQRQVSTMYKPLNQYHVVIVRSPAGRQVRLDAIARYGPAIAPLPVNHQGLFPSATISFNLQPGIALGDAVIAIAQPARKIGRRRPSRRGSPAPRRHPRVR